MYVMNVCMYLPLICEMLPIGTILATSSGSFINGSICVDEWMDGWMYECMNVLYMTEE